MNGCNTTGRMCWLQWQVRACSLHTAVTVHTWLQCKQSLSDHCYEIFTETEAILRCSIIQDRKIICWLRLYQEHFLLGTSLLMDGGIIELIIQKHNNIVCLTTIVYCLPSQHHLAMRVYHSTASNLVMKLWPHIFYWGGVEVVGVGVGGRGVEVGAGRGVESCCSFLFVKFQAQNLDS